MEAIENIGKIINDNNIVIEDTINKKIKSAVTTYALGVNGTNVTLTPSKGSAQSIVVPYATNSQYATNATNATNATIADQGKWLLCSKIDSVGYDSSDTHWMHLGYLKVSNYGNTTLLISSGFWGNQHNSVDLITIANDYNTNGDRVAQSTVNRVRLGGTHDRLFRYKNETDGNTLRVHLYVYVVGGNAYGKWYISILNSDGGSNWNTDGTKNVTLSDTIEVPLGGTVTGLNVGSSGAVANSAQTNPYLTVKDGSTYRAQARFVGSGATTVSSDANGNITISSTDNNTTYSASDGISLNETTFGLSTSGVTAGTYGPSANVTGSNNTTISVPEITVDTYGRVRSVTNRTYTSVNTDTTYSVATSSANGLMSSADKTKLDGIKLVTCTQLAYDAITTKDSNTFYFITES